MPTIEVENLTKRYDDLSATDNISFTSTPSSGSTTVPAR